jgi:type I restriction-modification system DNA methylase subunit
MANGNNTASIGFEQQIWAAADILRGNMVQPNINMSYLGLFFSYISDKFEKRVRQAAVSERNKCSRQRTVESEHSERGRYQSVLGCGHWLLPV